MELYEGVYYKIKVYIKIVVKFTFISLFVVLKSYISQWQLFRKVASAEDSWDVTCGGVLH